MRQRSTAPGKSNLDASTPLKEFVQDVQMCVPPGGSPPHRRHSPIIPRPRGDSDFDFCCSLAPARPMRAKSRLRLILSPNDSALVERTRLKIRRHYHTAKFSASHIRSCLGILSSEFTTDQLPTSRDTTPECTSTNPLANRGRPCPRSTMNSRFPLNTLPPTA